MSKEMTFAERFKDVQGFGGNGTSANATERQLQGRGAADPATERYMSKFALNAYDESGQPMASHLSGPVMFRR